MATKVLRQGFYETLYGSPLFIDWPLSFMCNYNCSYCFGHDRYDRNKFEPLEHYRIAIGNIARLNRPLYDITLAGGEPTLHPHFFYIVSGLQESLAERMNRIMITTNGSQSLEFMRKLADIGNNTEIVLNISLHTDHVRPQHIYELLTSLSAKMHFFFSLMYNPAKIDLVGKLFTDLLALRQDHAFDMMISTLREPPDFSRPDKRYTPELIALQEEMTAAFSEVAKKSPAQWLSRQNLIPTAFTEYLENDTVCKAHGGSRHLLFNSGLCNFKDMYCVAGAHLLRIEPNGAARGLVCPQATPYGNIFSPDFDISLVRPKLIVCAQDNCGCRANDCVPKFRDRLEAEAFVRNFHAHASGMKPPRPASPVRISDPNMGQLGDLLELIMILRPDVRDTYMGNGRSDYLGLLLWAWRYGVAEMPVLAAGRPVLAQALKELHAKKGASNCADGFSCLLAGLAAAHPDLRDMMRDSKGQEKIIAWFRDSGAKEYGLEELVAAR